MVAVLIQTGPDLTRTNFLKAGETICKWDNGRVISPKSLSPESVFRWGFGTPQARLAEAAHPVNRPDTDEILGSHG